MPNAKLIDGQEIANKILHNIAAQVATHSEAPGLATVLVGKNPASELYLKLKKTACEKVRMNYHSYIVAADCPEAKIIEVIEFLNSDPEINGILVQLPLPDKYNTEKIIKSINPDKDVDGFLATSKFTSPNILGIIELLKATGENLHTKNITILSNSKIFSQPFKKLLTESKVTYLNPKTPSPKLKAQCLKADILIVAVGKPKFIKPDMIKKDAILIDVGINKVKNIIVGDIDPACDKVASWRSPVPGGVGPMTVAMLLQNLLDAAKK